MLTFAASVFVFGLLVFFHELGHFVIAKMAGVKVYEFSLGFGPKLFSIPRGETAYNVRIFPLGGFVRMAGMDPQEGEEVDDKRNFNKKTVGWRMAIIMAGPLMNFVLAALLLTVVFMLQGHPVVTTRIDQVLAGQPAQSAGIQPGDKIVAINGEPVENWGRLVEVINRHPEEQITLDVQRDGTSIVIPVVTVKDEQGRGKIGIVPSYVLQKAGLFPALALGSEYTVRATALILDYIARMIFGQVPADLGGPVRVVTEIGKAAELGFFYLLQLATFLSINLGLFNLFPIPALDGSRVLFLAWEKVRGRPVDPAKENFIHLVGFGLLILLMVVITYNDILQLFLTEKLPGQR
ncbi:MAG: RIP metalloprotease RseP [Peptococcaceae bacterium]|nr:MAG: RIP metalloprotease RseP [Peptococcaceae bacterium]